MWYSAVCFKRHQRCLPLKERFRQAAQFHWLRMAKKNTINELWIFICKKPEYDSKSLFMGGRRVGAGTFLSCLLIPNPFHGKRMEVSIIVYFVKWDQIKLEAEWILCICTLVFQECCPGFKSPSLKWAHHKTNTVWQQAGSLCAYEAQNLMSMNNEYYSTCWWLSRLPVIRSMKALFSRERSPSRWMTDSHHPTHWK